MKTLDPKVRAERRRAVRLCEAYAYAYETLRREPGVVGEVARARVDMAQKLGDAIRRGVRS